MSASRTTASWAGACAAVVLTLSGCAAPGAAGGGAGGGLVREEPPMILPTPTATPTPTPTPESLVTECADASPAALAAVNASIAEDPGPYPGLQLDGLETVWDDDQQVWTLAGMVVPPVMDGVQPERFVALWATDRDPTRADFAGTVWAAVNGSEMVSAAPPLESFPPLTLDGPGPIGLSCSDFYPELAGRVG
ncbi:hypothetical protein [Clavibacter sp. km3a]|uniref:hypothetical protein n=1 Tax=Clavibacter sp. km3a TaxID=3459135 RepID=UPI0040428AFA